jgi:hypothetical protein
MVWELRVERPKGYGTTGRANIQHPTEKPQVPALGQSSPVQRPQAQSGTCPPFSAPPRLPALYPHGTFAPHLPRHLTVSSPYAHRR